MPTSVQSANQPGRFSPFVQQVKLALEHVTEPAWLGQHSPLAEPYFLGETLRQRGSLSTQANGVVLAQQLYESAVSLWGDPEPASSEEISQTLVGETQSDRYAFWLLCLSFFQRFTPAGYKLPLSQATIYSDILHISRATYDRHLATAIQRLSERLLERLQPALRNERPSPVRPLLGRETEIEQAIAALLTVRSVAITGTNGIGKSALGAEICNRWPNELCFWYTVRPTLNDRLPSLLFALAHFLHQHGKSLLWQQIVADHGEIPNLNLALGLARNALTTLSAPALLCFDNLDLLHPSPLDLTRSEHQPLLEFISSLRGVTATLLLSQQLTIECDLQIPLAGVSMDVLALMIEEAGICPSIQEIAHIHDYTNGNPQLIELCLALQSPGISLADTITQLPKTATLASMLSRVWNNSSASQRQMLQRLAVYRSSVPRSLANNDQEALAKLLERKLVSEDRTGGITLLLALRDAIYTHMSPESRQVHHLEAAQIRENRGDITAAAYHLHKAGEFETAVELWHVHMEQEIRRGQAPAAQQIFHQIAANRLSATASKRLVLLRARLYRLTGAAEDALEDLNSVSWTDHDLLSVDADSERGYFLQLQGNTTGALQAFDSGLQTLTELLQKRAQILVSRARLLQRAREIGRAQEDAQRVKFEAERLQGVLQEEAGNYNIARTHFWSALTIAEGLSDVAATANCYCHLAIVEVRHAKVEIAQEYFERAAKLYQQIGDHFRLESTRANLAGMFLQVGAYAEVIAPAKRALDYFRAAGDTLWVAALCSNLAEAYFNLDDIPAAQHFAEESLAQEERQFTPYAFFTLGEIARQQANFKRATHYYEQSVAFAGENEDRFMLAFALRGLGQTQQAEQNHESGRTQIERAADLFKQLGLEQEVQRTVDLMEG